MNRSTVEEIKTRLAIEDVVGSYVKLERAGKSFKAKCPFHNEKTASFFISPERGGYYCFGCGAKGDIFTFIEQFEGLDFRGALKILADKAGVPLVFDQRADGERDRLYEAMEEAAKYFESQFEKSSEATAYVGSRGISDATRKVFRIGWAPEGWRNLSDHMKGKGYSDAIIEKVGLIKRKDADTVGGTVISAGAGKGTLSSSSHYDRFRGRIMFPISDSSGRVIAFSGRILVDDGKAAKYLNSPDTPLYDKSMILYGLDKAKSEIRRMNYSIFVEGQMDLVMSHQAGIRNTVAASGTALSDDAFSESGAVNNLGLVRRLSPNVIIAFDSDQAGRKAAMRAAAIALGMGMDVKVADIVGGKDPADLVKENLENWKDVLRAAKPVIEFELGNVVREVADPRKLSRAIQDRVLPLLSRVESGSGQSYFVQMIADKAKIPVDVVWQDLKVVEKRIGQSDKSSSGAAVRTSSEQSKRIDLVERRLFGLLYLMEKDKAEGTDEFKERLEKAALDSYQSRKARADEVMGDLIFEAEAFFGRDKASWGKHMRELLDNFEEDIMGEELIGTMQELKAAEQAGNSDRVAELAKKCQALSIRKAEIGKKRRG